MLFWLADAGDHWLHHVLQGKALRSDHPRVKTKYLENCFEEVDDKPWASEMSGRALSLALDIRERAEAAAIASGAASIRFRHVIYAEVATVRSAGNLNVYVEPIDGDDAHANFVILEMPPLPYRTPADPKQSHDIFRQIAAMLRVCDASNLSPLEALRQQVSPR
jgi:hypothetical protein